jgi:hypothetical protein
MKASGLRSGHSESLGRMKESRRHAVDTAKVPGRDFRGDRQCRRHSNRRENARASDLKTTKKSTIPNEEASQA